MSGNDPIVTLGAGHCGGRAAEWLRRLGYDGRLMLLGAEALAPYERPPLSKGLLTGDKSLADCQLHDDAFYTDQGIELLAGRAAEAIDPKARRITLGDATDLTYGKLLMATGSTPRRLYLPGSNLEGVLTLRDVGDSEAIRSALTPGARIAVVGGGFIGLEVAASARKVGANVVVLEAAERLLGRSVPAEVAEAIGTVHRDNGVEIRLGAKITGFLGETRVSAVELGDGDHIETSCVVIGIGIQPETRLAEAAGIPCEDGILAHATCATPVQDVYVAGDAARALNARYGKQLRLESWQNAEQQAEIAARAMLGLEASWESVPWVWSDQYDWNLQGAGFPTDGSAVVSRGSPADGKALFFALRDGQLVGAAALGQGLSAAKDLRVAQMLIEREVRPPAAALADTSTNLKALLNAA